MPRLNKAHHRILLLVLFAGLVQVAGFAPVGIYVLPWLALALLAYSLRRATTLQQSLSLGFAFGLGAFLGGVSWVYVSLSVFGGMPAPLAAVASALFCATLAIFPALAAGVTWQLGRSAGGGLYALTFAASWALGEWLRGTVLTGFPWLAAGYSQVPASPLAGFASLIGVYGVSFVLALLAAAIAESVVRWRGEGGCPATGHARGLYASVPLLMAAGLLALGFSLRGLAWTVPSGGPLRVALLQGNIAQDMKWRPETFRESLETYAVLQAEHAAALTILPETALPAFYEALPPAYLATLTAQARANGGDVLLGVVSGDSARYANSVISLGVSPTQRYEKTHLVPFGEFIPPGFAWVMRVLSVPLSGFSAGVKGQPPLAVGGAQVAMNICYEDLFGEELLAAVPRATILANVSNTAWFGRSLAQPQHLQISQMRALETGRPMLRATNTGMTAYVSPEGQVVAALPAFSRAALVVDVQGYTGLTPYVRYGNTPILVLIALLLGLSLLTARVRTKQKR